MAEIEQIREMSLALQQEEQSLEERAEKFWNEHCKPHFDACTTIEQHMACRRTLGIVDDKMPHPIGVKMVFEMDRIRQLAGPEAS